MKFSIIFLLFLPDIQSFDKAVDTAGLKTYGAGTRLADSINFRFNLNRAIRQSTWIHLLASKNGLNTPLMIEINPKTKKMRISKKRKGKFTPLGKTQEISAFNTGNKDNEMTISFDDTKWVILVNGEDVSDELTNIKPDALIHNNSYDRLKLVKVHSPKPIRRISITKDLKIDEWVKMNHPDCGLGYEMTTAQKQEAPQRILDSANGYQDAWLDECTTARDGLDAGSAANRIVGGVELVPGQYPWLVSFLKMNADNEPEASCGGSLINKCWILSAAHCFESETSIRNLKVRVGDFNIKKKWDWAESEHDTTIKQIIKHEAYEWDTLANDIALIEMAECLPEFTQFASPICLPTSTTQFGANDCCTMAGWGKTASDEEQLAKFVAMETEHKRIDSAYKRLYTENTELFPPTPRMTFNYIADPQKCYDHFKPTSFRYDMQSNFCSNHRFKSKLSADTCQGDSGGPVQCEMPLANYENHKSSISGAQVKSKRFTLWGITSGGGGDENCGDSTGDATIYGVYVRVVNYMSWIQDKFQKNNVQI